MHRQLTPYIYQIFLHKVSDGQRGAQHHVLYNVDHSSILLYKTASGSPVSSVLIHHYG